MAQHPPTLTDHITPDTPLFWSSWGRRRQGKIRRPITSKNIWRLCKTYGRIIGYPMLKPHDLRHGVTMEILEHHHDLEVVGHSRTRPGNLSDGAGDTLEAVV